MFSYTVRVHMKTHTEGAKSFLQCLVCLCTCVSLHVLVVHARTHTHIRACLFIFCPHTLGPPSLTSSVSTAPLWQRLSKQNNLESFSVRPGNVNRLRRNITPTGVCGRHASVSEGVSERVKEAERERKRRDGVCYTPV